MRKLCNEDFQNRLAYSDMKYVSKLQLWILPHIPCLSLVCASDSIAKSQLAPSKTWKHNRLLLTWYNFIKHKLNELCQAADTLVRAPERSTALITQHTIGRNPSTLPSPILIISLSECYFIIFFRYSNECFQYKFPIKFFINSLFLPILVTCQPVYVLNHRNLTIKFGQYKPLFIKHIILNHLLIYSF
jgi:hypothetical protein